MECSDDHTVSTLSAAAGEGDGMDVPAAACLVAQKCKHSQVVNCTLCLHEKTVPAELLHKHGRNAFAAPTNMWNLIPC